MQLIRTIPVSANGKDYEIRVFSDGADYSVGATTTIARLQPGTASRWLQTSISTITTENGRTITWWPPLRTTSCMAASPADHPDMHDFRQTPATPNMRWN